MKHTSLHGGEHERMDEALAEIAAEAAEAAAPAELRSRLLAEVSRRAAGRARHGGGLPVQPALHWRWAGSALAVAVALLLFWTLGPGRARRPVSAPAGSYAARSLSGTTTASYVALPYSDPSIANGTETEVSVTLSPSELMAWGVAPASGDPDGDVHAVLVLGDDGLPLAVRVLSPSIQASTDAEEILP